MVNIKNDYNFFIKDNSFERELNGSIYSCLRIWGILVYIFLPF